MHRAILDLKVQRDKLQQYQKRIAIITDRETEIARECLRSGNKQKALLALRRKKYQESLLSKTDQQLAQLQALTSDVEFALVQKDVLFGLQQGTAVLKEIHKEMGGLNKVEMILGESEEAQAYQKVSLDRLHTRGTRMSMLMLCNRKSTRCLEARCRMKTRTKWRTNWRRWRGNLRLCRQCQMRLLKSPCQMYRRAILNGRRRGRMRGREDERDKSRLRHE